MKTFGFITQILIILSIFCGCKKDPYKPTSCVENDELVYLSLTQDTSISTCLLEGEELLIDASNDTIDTYEWLYTNNFTPFTTISKIKSSYFLKVVVVSFSGYSDTLELSLLNTCPKMTIYIPTTFTPNGDMKNDTYFPEGQGIYSYTMIIRDPDGIELFRSNDLDYGWDGKYHGNAMPPGIYQAAIRVFDHYCEEKVYNVELNLVW